MKSFHFHPFPKLITERLQLRQLRLRDDKALLVIRSDKQVGRYLSRPLEENLEGCQIFIRNINKGIQNREWIYWGITVPPGDQVVGTICLWNLSFKEMVGEIGYELHPDFQRQGFMQEAIKAVVDYGFKIMRLQRIEAYLQAGNRSSLKLLERSNFRFLRTAGDEEKFEAEAGMRLLAYELRNPGG